MIGHNPTRRRAVHGDDATSRRFWAVAIGVMVEGYAMGRAADELSSEMLRVLGDQATAKSISESARLRLVGNPTSSNSPEGESSS